MAAQEIDADEAMQNVLNAWGTLRTSRPEPQRLSESFTAPFEKMMVYRTAKSTADNSRAHHILTDREIAQKRAGEKDISGCVSRVLRGAGLTQMVVITHVRYRTVFQPHMWRNQETYKEVNALFSSRELSNLNWAYSPNKILRMFTERTPSSYAILPTHAGRSKSG
jgi:hypothetical protein